MKKIISFFIIISCVFFAQAQSEPIKKDVELASVELAFRTVALMHCENIMIKNIPVEIDDKKKTDMIEKVCDCYTGKIADKMDWDKYYNMSDKERDMYSTDIEKNNRNEVIQECKKELNNNIVQEGFADAHKKIDCREGLISRKEGYDGASTFEKFKIRWDSNVRKSVEKRAKECRFSDDKKFYTVMEKDRTNDVINGISFLFCISLVLIIAFLSKNKKS